MITVRSLKDKRMKLAEPTESTVLRSVNEKFVVYTVGEHGTWFIKDDFANAKSRPLTLNVGEAKLFSNADEIVGAVSLVCTIMDIADTFGVAKAKVIREVVV